MSVIAKVYVAGEPRDYGSSTLVELSCVAEDKFMAMYNKDDENFLFTQASPSGDARVNFPKGTPFRNMENLYVIFHRTEEVPNFRGAMATVDAWCVSITDFGGTSKRVEIASKWRDSRQEKAHPLLVDAFNFRITIDNPAASVQFEPGKQDYWIGIYRASDFTADEALALARP